MRLLYFSPVAASSYAQRPHFMVRAWLAAGAESVLWVNPYPCRLPRLEDLHRVIATEEQSSPLDPRIRVLDVPALPIEPLPLGPWLNRRLLWSKTWREIERFVSGGETVFGIGRPCWLASNVLTKLRPAASFYDAMDDFPEFYSGLSRRAMQRRENALAAAVDLVLASSTFLTEKFQRRGLKVEKLLNACELCESGKSAEEAADIHHSSFIIHTSTNPPSPIPNLSAAAGSSSLTPSCPVLGYIGCLGHWFDWPLVVKLALSVPQARIELIGPCAVRPPKQLPSNIRLLPVCRQSEVGAHLSRFTVGLIPFRCCALTAGVDPIKYYEYRAAGLPVLSTRFGEMSLRGPHDGVYFIGRSNALSAAVAVALAHPQNSAETEAFRRAHNWSTRFHNSAMFDTLSVKSSRLAA